MDPAEIQRQRVKAVLGGLTSRGLYKVVSTNQVNSEEVNDLLRCLGLPPMDKAEQDLILQRLAPKEWGNNWRGTRRVIPQLIMEEENLRQLKEESSTMDQSPRGTLPLALGDAEDIKTFSLTEPNPSRAIVIANPGGTEVVDGTWELVITHVALDLNERGTTTFAIGIGSRERSVREKAKRLQLRSSWNHHWDRGLDLRHLPSRRCCLLRACLLEKVSREKEHKIPVLAG